MSSTAGTEPVLPSQPRLFSVTAVVASCVGFVVIGALQALYGPALPTFREKFGLQEAVAGLALSCHFVGALLGVLMFHRMHDRIGNRTLLGSSYGLMAIGSVLFAVAPDWPAALVATLVIGVGFGGIDYGLNQLFSVGFGRRSVAMLNLLNAHFGVGAVAGPALIGWLGTQRYPWIFAGFGVVSGVLLLSLAGVRQDKPVQAARPQKAANARRPLALIGVFVAIYVLHVGIETGVGGW